MAKLQFLATCKVILLKFKKYDFGQFVFLFKQPYQVLNWNALHRKIHM